MTPSRLEKRVVVDRLDWIQKMIHEINRLPLDSYEAFSADARNVWSAESCLRRALEALFDLGRHLLAKGFGSGVSEYKQIAEELGKAGVLSPEEAMVLRTLAGYRNRMVHFYQEITPPELYSICTEKLADLRRMRYAFRDWVKANPEKLNERL